MPCWTELDSHPGCYVLLVEIDRTSESTTTWSAGCTDGLANGSGTLAFVGDRTADLTGLLRGGKPVGHWVLTNGSYVFEGPYVDTRRHGRWVSRHPNGAVGEGQYVEGKQHGYCLEITRGGGVREGQYVEDKRQGRWVLRQNDGTTIIETYIDDIRQP